MVFNRYERADIEAQKEVVTQAVAKARQSGVVQARGNSAATARSITGTVQVSTGDELSGFHSSESGVDEDGNTYTPFILGIDGTLDNGAYVPMGHPVKDYGR